MSAVLYSFSRWCVLLCCVPAELPSPYLLIQKCKRLTRPTPQFQRQCDDCNLQAPCPQRLSFSLLLKQEITSQMRSYELLIIAFIQSRGLAVSAYADTFSCGAHVGNVSLNLAFNFPILLLYPSFPVLS